MTRSLIALPVRLGLRGAGIAVDGFTAIAGRALGLAAQLADVVTKDGGPDLDLDGSEHAEREREHAERDQGRQEPEPARPEPAGRQPTSAPGSPGAPNATEPSAPEVRPDPAPAASAEAPAIPEVSPAPAESVLESEPLPEPAHVSEEPTLVEEVAEPGAEDGAGAEVRVAEPWDGYREMAADDVIDRISGASSATLAAVELFELSHRSRKTVLTAVRRELARADR